MWEYVRILVSFWDGPFSGAMLVFRRVDGSKTRNSDVFGLFIDFRCLQLVFHC